MWNASGKDGRIIGLHCELSPGPLKSHSLVGGLCRSFVFKIIGDTLNPTRTHHWMLPSSGRKSKSKRQLLAQLPAGLLDPMKLDYRLLRCLNGFREGPFVGKGGNVIGPGSGGIHGKGRLAANSWPANVEVLLVIDSTGQCFLLAGLGARQANPGQEVGNWSSARTNDRAVARVRLRQKWAFG